MAIGSSKIGILGGISIVPGGVQVFNSSGTFTVPAGVTKLNIKGTGGTGGAGNGGGAGGTGSSGFAGGGGGGGGGNARMCYDQENNFFSYKGTGSPGNAGSAGNAGGAGTTATFNCITVTAGGSYPISVGSGGTANVFWSPQ